MHHFDGGAGTASSSSPPFSTSLSSASLQPPPIFGQYDGDACTRLAPRVASNFWPAQGAGRHVVYWGGAVGVVAGGAELWGWWPGLDTVGVVAGGGAVGVVARGGAVVSFGISVLSLFCFAVDGATRTCYFWLCDRGYSISRAMPRRVPRIKCSIWISNLA
jgi:hypothetical protein